MAKRIFFWLVAAAVVLSVPANAQQAAKVPRLGMLVSGSPETHGRRVDAFLKSLQDLGYVEGKNIAIEYMYGRGDSKRFADLGADMVRLKPDVIYVSSTALAQAAQKATTTIPIVATAGDLVRSKLVASLARPGGNITGSTNISPDVSGKRLELLKESCSQVISGSCTVAPEPRR
jgi:putative ABC transport system substrate-binding protein